MAWLETKIQEQLFLPVRLVGQKITWSFQRHLVPWKCAVFCKELEMALLQYINNNMEIVQYSVKNYCRIYKMSWFSYTLWKRENNFKCKGYGNAVNKHQCIRGFFMQQARFIFTEKLSININDCSYIRKSGCARKPTFQSFSVSLNLNNPTLEDLRSDSFLICIGLIQDTSWDLKRAVLFNTWVSENQVHFPVWDQPRFNSMFLNRQNELELSKHFVRFGQ